MKKIKLILMGCSLVLFLTVFGTGNASDTINKTKRLEVQYAADFNDNRVLVGASHNVFVGKVVKEIGLKERGLGPETHFLVEIIKNIKGELKGMVIVNQQGGYKDGVLHMVGDEYEIDSNDPYLLQPGWTYVFATRRNKEGQWLTLNPHPAALILVTPNTKLDKKHLEWVDSHWRVRQLASAYKNEILIDADLKNNFALNNYKESIRNSILR